MFSGPSPFSVFMRATSLAPEVYLNSCFDVIDAMILRLTDRFSERESWSTSARGSGGVLRPQLGIGCRTPRPRLGYLRETRSATPLSIHRVAGATHAYQRGAVYQLCFQWIVSLSLWMR